MKSMHFIGLDAHCQVTEVAVVTQAGRLTKRARCRTAIPDLAAAIDAVPQPRCVVLEESTIADWLLRGLQARGESVTVCDPRRNRLIAKESDKDDPLDAEKLAQLFRGGYVKAVHHAESLERAVFKQHVGLYHDRVRQRVREANRILGFLRYHGVFVREAAFLDPAERPALLARLPRNGLLRRDLQLLWKSYDSLAEQVERMRGRLLRQARRQEQIRRFAQVPGVSWIRGATFFAYLDTPWRFRSKAALWRYVGIGLERRHSGEGPVLVRVALHANRILKNVVLGAAQSSIRVGGNPFAEEYQRLQEEAGLSPRNARRVVARHLAATLWGMWKNGSDYRPECVSQAARQKASLQTGRCRPARGRDQRPQFPPPDPHPLPSSLLFQVKPMQR